MKIRYYSELLNKEFDTKADCELAEAKYNEAHQAEIQREAERKELYNKVTAAREKATSARKEYDNLVNEYNKKYNEPYKYNTDNLQELIYNLFGRDNFAL